MAANRAYTLPDLFNNILTRLNQTSGDSNQSTLTPVKVTLSYDTGTLTDTATATLLSPDPLWSAATTYGCASWS